MLITNWAELKRLNFLPRLFNARGNNADEHTESIPGRGSKGWHWEATMTSWCDSCTNKTERD